MGSRHTFTRTRKFLDKLFGSFLSRVKYTNLVDFVANYYRVSGTDVCTITNKNSHYCHNIFVFPTLYLLLPLKRIIENHLSTILYYLYIITYLGFHYVQLVIKNKKKNFLSDANFRKHCDIRYDYNYIYGNYYFIVTNITVDALCRI